jgi:DUF2938 family protein
MTETVEFALRTVLIGVGATLVMDGWGLVLRQFGVPSLNFALLGRWLRQLPGGTWVHERIAREAPVPGERLIGWSAHYAIGMTFAAILLSTFGLKWARAPSLLPALLIGVVTVAAPLLILQPVLGAGIASVQDGTVMATCPIRASFAGYLRYTRCVKLRHQSRHGASPARSLRSGSAA